MKIAIESTEKIVGVAGHGCRVWRGVTQRGIPCILLVHRLAVRSEEDASQFDAELREMLPPGVATELGQALEQIPKRHG